MATNKIQTGLRLDSDTLAKITFIAKKQKRSLNAQIEYAVQQAVEEYERAHGEIIVDPDC